MLEEYTRILGITSVSLYDALNSISVVILLLISILSCSSYSRSVIISEHLSQLIKVISVALNKDRVSGVQVGGSFQMLKEQVVHFELV